MNLISATEQKLQQRVAERLLNNPEQKKLIVSRAMQAFLKTRRAPVPDLVERTQRLQERLEKMVEDLSVEFKLGRLVVKPTGSSEPLMAELRRGTDWYDPVVDIDNIIVAAIMVDPKRS